MVFLSFINPYIFPDFSTFHARLQSTINSLPLICALIAPLSTLLDIPALTEHWYLLDGVTQKDPVACVVLSAIGLFLNFTANCLLLVRFSAKKRKWWTKATTASTICWVGKTLVAVANLITFGALTRNKKGYTYTEGFFCAIASVVLSGIISFLLLLHYAYMYRRSSAQASLKIRITGSEFMISITMLLVVIGIQALVYNLIENWGYFNSIYFSVVTMLTIGFGDFFPSTVATKVLLLPFAILTISQLGNQVSMIVTYFSDRDKTRRARWKSQFEAVVREEEKNRNPKATLKEEMKLVQYLAKHEQMTTQIYGLTWSFANLIIFWSVGAAIFQKIESWSYGTAFYFNIVFGLTIGFGDVAPITPGGRVFFVLYSLASVPLIAAFAVQSATGVLSEFSNWRHKKKDAERNNVFESSAFRAHGDYILQHRKNWNRLMAEPTWTRDSDETHTVVTDEQMIEEQTRLVNEVIHQALKLEAISRQLLVQVLPKGSLSQMLLVADRNVQLRDVDSVGGDAQKLEDLWLEEIDPNEKDRKQENTDPNLDTIRRYRETFAKFLVAGTLLKKLEGEEVYRFERRRSETDDIDISSLSSDPIIADVAAEAEREARETGVEEKLSHREKIQERHRLAAAMIKAERERRKKEKEEEDAKPREGEIP